MTEKNKNDSKYSGGKLPEGHKVLDELPEMTLEQWEAIVFKVYERHKNKYKDDAIRQFIFGPEPKNKK